MVRISVQAAHEQVNPIDLLDDVVNMDQMGLNDVGQAIIICHGGTAEHLEALHGRG